MKTSEQLLTAYRAGDRLAFVALQGRLGTALRSYLDTRCGHPAMCCRVFGKLAAYRGPVPDVQGWLFRRAFRLSRAYRPPEPELTAAEIAAAEAEAKADHVSVTTALWRTQRRKAALAAAAV